VSVNPYRATERAAELRLAFDHGFAQPISIDTTFKEDLLAIRAGGQPHAIRLSEISGLFADKKIIRIPGSDPALRGVAGFRGTILPVYGLESFLGGAGNQTPRWLAVAVAAPVAFAFETFERQLRVARDQFMPQASRPDALSHVREFVRTQNFVGPVICLASILEAITTRGPQPGVKAGVK
jgi:chemotaxis signal transduction protein